MNYLKRWVSLFLIFTLCLSACPTAQATGKQTILTKINKIAETYPHGSYFSVNGKACRPCGGEYCTNCGVTYVAAKDGKSWASTEDTSGQCLAFTRYVYHELFGIKLGSVNKGTVSATVVSQGKANQYATYANAKPGDVLYFRNSAYGSDIHFGIFVSADDSGVTIYHANVSGTTRVEYRKYSYKTEVGAGNYVPPYVIIRHSNNYHVCSKYNDLGNCTECGLAFTLQQVTTVNQLALATKKNGAIHTSPYGAATINGRLTKDKYYSVSQSAVNAKGKTWYKLQKKDNKGRDMWVINSYLKLHTCKLSDSLGRCKECYQQIPLKNVKALNQTMVATQALAKMYKEPYTASQVTGRLQTFKSPTYQAVQSAVNAKNQLWYQVKDTDGQLKWVKSSYLRLQTPTPTNTNTNTSIVIKTTGAQNITSTNAKVTGQVSYSGTRPSRVGLLFGTNKSQLKDVANEAINFTKNPFDIWYDLNTEAKITLTAGTTYYYQFYAIVNGQQILGNIDSFQTTGSSRAPVNSNSAIKDVVNALTPASNITVTATSAKNITETNAVVYGAASYSGTRPSEVGLQFGTSSSSLKTVASESINFSKNPFDIWYDLNKEANTYLSAGTTYYYRMYAKVNGSYSYSNIVSFTTPAKPAATTSPVTATAIGVRKQTGTNAEVYGTVAYSGARPSKVGLRFGTSMLSLNVVASENINFSKNPFDVWYDLNKEAGITLTPGKIYYYQFFVVVNGQTYYSNMKFFKA